MVCSRCIMVVQKLLEDCGHTVLNVQLGEVTIATTPDKIEKIHVAEKIEVNWVLN
jgi:hypothetical protein